MSAWEHCRVVSDALHALGKRDFVLAIHDGSFPSAPGEDIGRGTPYSKGAAAFLEFIRELGFTGLQLGPQGQTTRFNPSPYDGTVFSKNVLSIDLADLSDRSAWDALLTPARVEDFVQMNPSDDGRRVQHTHVYDVYQSALSEAHAHFVARLGRGHRQASALGKAIGLFRARQAHWLESDAMFHLLSSLHGDTAWETWPTTARSRFDQTLFAPAPGTHAACARRREQLAERYDAELSRYAFSQFVVHRQHERLHARCQSIGLKLFGDLQIGLSRADEWSRQSCLLSGYRLGAPPSRTNPAGQPWGYRLLDPAQLAADDVESGSALEFFKSRIQKLLDEVDGVRIDHPHGLVCPWVYAIDDDNSYRAVQGGARLFSSPHLPDHPTLARYSIVRPEQLASGPRHADAWVSDLTEAQLDQYGVLIDTVVDVLRSRGRAREDVICEVLSTCPRPLAEVLARHELGRFRVTQKAKVDDPNDVYRADRARFQDWIMVGNHDTPPVWSLIERWRRSGASEARIRYLTRRLCPDGNAAAFAAQLEAHPSAHIHAEFADLFASDAAHVMVFFSDLLGYRDVYNVPGEVRRDNWTLRVSPDYANEYRRAVSRREALNIPHALALAFRARGAEFTQRNAGLLDRLDSLARFEPR